MNKNINTVWANIVKHQGEIFRIKNGTSFTYIIENNYVIVSGIKGGNIPKNHIEKALCIENPTPGKLSTNNIWSPSYVYGIITDDRIINIKSESSSGILSKLLRKK